MKLCPCGKPVAKRNGNRGRVPNFCDDHKNLTRHQKRVLSGYADKRYERMRKPCSRCGGPKEPGSRKKNCDACPPLRQLDKEGAAVRREDRRKARELKALQTRTEAPKLRKPRAVTVKLKPKTVPADVRAAWRVAHWNSIIRQKYPTTKALQRGAARGDFDRVAA